MNQRSPITGDDGFVAALEGRFIDAYAAAGIAKVDLPDWTVIPPPAVVKPSNLTLNPIVELTLASIKLPDVFAPNTNNGVAEALVLFTVMPYPAEIIDNPTPVPL